VDRRVIRSSKWILYEAIADGLCQVGLAANHIWLAVSERRCRHEIEIDTGTKIIRYRINRNNSISYRIWQSGCWSHPRTGPELADPDFFEKVKLLCE
jgi:hypothetical protein